MLSRGLKDATYHRNVHHQEGDVFCVPEMNSLWWEMYISTTEQSKKKENIWKLVRATIHSEMSPVPTWAELSKKEEKPFLQKQHKTDRLQTRTQTLIYGYLSCGLNN